MIFVANEKLRKYLAFEDGKWIHDPNMPDELESDFLVFVEAYENAKKESNSK